MIVKIVVSYSLMLGLYIICPILGWIYIILSLFFLLYKRINCKFFIISLILFFLSFYLTNNPINNSKEHFGVVINTSDNFYIFFSKGNCYYIYEKNNYKEIGDFLKIKGEIESLSFSHYESDFDFLNFLNNKNVFYELNVESETILVSTFLRINNFKRLLINDLNNETKEFIKMYLFSDSSLYSSLTSAIGLYSLFSSSGILFYSLLEIVKKVIFRFCSFKKRDYIPYIIVTPLIFLTNFKIGIIRAFITSLNNDLLNKKIKRNEIYAFTLLLALLFNPFYFKTASFIYSFVLPYLIFYLNEAIKAFKTNFQQIVKNLFIQFLFLPFIVFFNDSFSVISIIFMIFFKQLFGLIYSIIYLLIFLPFVNKLLNYLCPTILHFIAFLERINFSIYFKDISLVVVIIYLLLYFVSIIMFEFKNIKKGMVSFSIMILFILGNSSTFNTYFFSYISFIDVGQGDSILIHDKNIDVLIDTGGSLYKDIANDVLIPYLNKCGIRDLDYVFLSHSDNDHSGAFDELCSNFIVKNYVIGSSFSLIEVGDLKFQNLNRYGTGVFDNDDSSVIKLEFYSNTYLFTGDISSKIEEKLIMYENLEADILKVSHHGSNTSSSYEFLKKVNPRIAVISVGENNYYNHPSSIIVNRLLELGIKVYRTDIEGTITFSKYI